MREWEFHLLEDRTPVEELKIEGRAIRKGDRVRLRPGGRSDAFDLMLIGETAVVESIEQDYENRFHIGVVLDRDPGRDVGFMRQPGHRFFFAPEDIECLDDNDDSSPRKRILVAGIGNIFHGDDAFGVEVVKRLDARNLPDGVRVVDFGIRSFDLACALTSGYHLAILVDACLRGHPPGTLFVIEPELPEPQLTEQPAMVETHAMKPVEVLHLANRLGGPLNRILLVGCEPETLTVEDGQMGLSQTVADSLEEAVALIESLIEDFLKDHENSPNRKPERRR